MSVELDRRIATEVMQEPEPTYGVPVEAVMRGMGVITSGYFSGGENWEAFDLYPQGPTWKPVPFSSNLKHAMRAVDKVFEGSYGRRLTIEYYPASALSDKYIASFSNQECVGESIPEAVCKLLLALKETR